MTKRANGTECKICGGGKCICRNFCIKCYAEVILPQENGLCIECDSSVFIKENPINYTHCRCLNCGEVFLVDEEDEYHTSQLCRKYCSNEFLRSLNERY